MLQNPWSCLSQPQLGLPASFPENRTSHCAAFSLLCLSLPRMSFAQSYLLAKLLFFLQSPVQKLHSPWSLPDFTRYFVFVLTIPNSSLTTTVIKCIYVCICVYIHCSTHIDTYIHTIYIYCSSFFIWLLLDTLSSWKEGTHFVSTTSSTVSKHEIRDQCWMIDHMEHSIKLLREKRREKDSYTKLRNWIIYIFSFI